MSIKYAIIDVSTAVNEETEFFDVVPVEWGITDIAEAEALRSNYLNEFADVSPDNVMVISYREEHGE